MQRLGSSEMALDPACDSQRGPRVALHAQVRPGERIVRAGVVLRLWDPRYGLPAAPGRALKRLDVHEVSPVVRGAGIGTLALKSRGSFAHQLEATIEELETVICRARESRPCGRSRDESRGRPVWRNSQGQQRAGLE